MTPSGAYSSDDARLIAVIPLHTRRGPSTRRALRAAQSRWTTARKISSWAWAIGPAGRRPGRALGTVGEACAADRPGADGPNRNLVTERPYVLLSCAMSVDGCLDAPGRERLVLSGAADMDRVDDERASSDAIMVGAGTIRRDDPRLLIRSPERRAARTADGRPAHPIGVTLTAGGDLDPGALFFSGGGSAGGTGGGAAPGAGGETADGGGPPAAGDHGVAGARAGREP